MEHAADATRADMDDCNVDFDWLNFDRLNSEVLVRYDGRLQIQGSSGEKILVSTQGGPSQVRRADGTLEYEGAVVLDLDDYVGGGRYNMTRPDREGHGTEYYSDGETKKYVGEWYGWRDGQGTSFRRDGTREYKGAWSRDRRDGAGVSYKSDGTTIEYDGTWREGEPLPPPAPQPLAASSTLAPANALTRALRDEREERRGAPGAAGAPGEAFAQPPPRAPTGRGGGGGGVHTLNDLPPADEEEDRCLICGGVSVPDRNELISCGFGEGDCVQEPAEAPRRACWHSACDPLLRGRPANVVCARHEATARFKLDVGASRRRQQKYTVLTVPSYNNGNFDPSIPDEGDDDSSQGAVVAVVDDGRDAAEDAELQEDAEYVTGVAERQQQPNAREQRQQERRRRQEQAEQQQQQQQQQQQESSPPPQEPERLSPALQRPERPATASVASPAPATPASTSASATTPTTAPRTAPSSAPAPKRPAGEAVEPPSQLPRTRGAPNVGSARSKEVATPQPPPTSAASSSVARALLETEQVLKCFGAGGAPQDFSPFEVDLSPTGKRGGNLVRLYAIHAAKEVGVEGLPDISTPEGKRQPLPPGWIVLKAKADAVAANSKEYRDYLMVTHLAAQAAMEVEGRALVVHFRDGSGGSGVLHCLVHPEGRKFFKQVATKWPTAEALEKYRAANQALKPTDAKFALRLEAGLVRYDTGESVPNEDTAFGMAQIKLREAGHAVVCATTASEQKWAVDLHAKAQSQYTKALEALAAAPPPSLMQRPPAP